MPVLDFICDCVCVLHLFYMVLLQLSCYGVDKPNHMRMHKRTHGIKY